MPTDSPALPPSFPPLNAERLWARVETLARYTLPDQPWTRRAFSPLFLEAREWLRGEFEAAGLTTRLDAGGNLIGTRAGRNAQRKPIATGSHCDTVMSGGRFDGIIGVLAGIEVAHTMQEHGITLDHPFEVIDFLSEEPSDYGISCVGSRALCGQLSADMLAARNPQGETLAQGIARIGGDPAALNAPLRRAGETAAFVELHIEQGPRLIDQGLQIGLVKSIVGQRRYTVTVKGIANHAGTTPMNDRADALQHAVDLIVTLREQARRLNPDLTFTVGEMHISPNTSNVIPGLVTFTVDCRNSDEAVLDQFERLLQQTVTAPGNPQITSSADRWAKSDVTLLDRQLLENNQAIANQLGFKSFQLASGAGHDSQIMAKHTRTTMIFVPSINGISHAPAENTSQEDLLRGVELLAASLHQQAY